MTSRAEDEPATRPPAGVILAIGASGAKTDSLARVLAGLPLDTDEAVVLALQYREALDEDGLRRALGERADTLSAVVDGAPIEAGRIYLPEPDLLVTVEEGRFRTQPAEQAPGERGTIDSFFVSLAQDQDGSTIGLILAGTAGDGTLGVAAVKEAGGLTLAEESEETEAAHLAVSNNPAALVDLILPADEIPGRVALHARHLARQRKAAALDAQAAAISDMLAGIVAVLRDGTGHDFHGYKRNTFLRRVQRRMEVVETDRVEAYLEILRTRPDEVRQLFNDLLIGVTQFFRDRREFEFLEAQVIPKLFEGRSRNDQLRVWVLGCSSGEEAYSIAILLREHAAKLDAVPQIQIFASDIDGRALAAARVGRYTSAIAEHMTPERLARWFVKEGNTYCVVKELREMCVFSQHSIIKDAPFSRLDMISCRNLLIYLNADLQSRVIPLFHFALKPSGFLFLGTSENISRHQNLFASVDRGFRIFQKIETGTRPLPDFPFTTVDRRPATVPATQPRPRLLAEGLARHAERLAERYAPAYVIVNENFDVLNFSSRAGRFIHPVGGAASLNLLNLIHADLRLDLRGALDRAMRENSAVQAGGLQMSENGDRVVVDLIVEPIQGNHHASKTFVVLFRDNIILPDMGETSPDAASLRDERVRRLELELRVSRERLQATIEELESTNEELKSSNEEYQSLNEELQSANEELETSKEELQSINEELTTVNGELAHRVQELGRVNSDVKNLLESTQIATIFLDNELRVMNFTPALAEIFHLVETDIGRPIEHIKSRVSYDELQDDVRRVIRTLATIEREVENPATHARFMVRVLPYRSVDNFIAGAVVTFTDVTPLTRAERALRESEAHLLLQREFLDTLIRQVPVGISIAEAPSGRVIVLNDRARELLGYGERGDGINPYQTYGAVHPDGRPYALDDDPSMRALRHGEIVAHEEAIYRHSGASADENAVTRRLEVSSAPVRDKAGAIVAAVTILYDVEERRRAEEALRESEARFRSFVENSTDVLWIVDEEAGRLEYLSPSYEAVWGEPRERIMKDLGRWAELIHPDDRARAGSVMPLVLAGKTCAVEYRVVRPDGVVRWIHDTGFPIPGAQGRIRRVGGIAQDVTEQKAAEERLRELNQALEARVVERTAELSQALARLRAEAQEREQAEAALRQSQKMEAVGQLTGGIAHDFNNLLQSIGGTLEMLQRRVEQGRAEQAARYVESGRKAVERAAALTHRLLAFARRQALQPCVVEPDSLVEGMAELIQRTVGPGVAVELRMGNGIWTVLCDPNQLENALLNLAINARDAMPEGGRLTITTEDVSLAEADVADQDGVKPGDYVEIAVGDTGTGMDEPTKARVFEPFFTTKPLGHGTGLGLSQLYGFVRQSGGVVRLDSAPGQGTTARLYLPRFEPAQGQEKGPAHGTYPVAGGGEAVLLIEDEQEVRETAGERLRELGYQVVEAADGPAALRLLRSGAQVDLLVTDVGLPGGLNGRQVADAAREQRPGLPVLFITGYAGSVLEGQLAPNMAVIAKPFALDALAARVRGMINDDGAAHA